MIRLPIITACHRNSSMSRRTINNWESYGTFKEGGWALRHQRDRHRFVDVTRLQDMFVQRKMFHRVIEWFAFVCANFSYFFHATRSSFGRSKEAKLSISAKVSSADLMISFSSNHAWARITCVLINVCDSLLCEAMSTCAFVKSAANQSAWLARDAYV